MNTTTASILGKKKVLTDWEHMLSLLPKRLDALAIRTHAVERWRCIFSAQLLLRLLLLWALSGMGLRSVAGWAASHQLATLSEGALRYRFARAYGFLRAILLHLLNAWNRTAPAAHGWALRIVDASGMARSGLSARMGSAWRIHTVYDPVAARLLDLQITDQSIPESLLHAPCAKGDLVIADRGYSRARQLVALAKQCVWWLVRVHLQNLPLYASPQSSTKISPMTWIEQMQSEPYIDQDVFILDRGQWILARLVVARLPADKVEQARERTKRRAMRSQRRATSFGLKACECIYILTTLPRGVASWDAVLQWYRVRWQIELYFKRLKSLLNWSVVNGGKDQLQAVRILATVIVAALIDRMNLRQIDSNPSTQPPHGSEVAHQSLWRLTAIHGLQILVALAHETPWDHQLQKRDSLNKAIRERPRKRHLAAAACKILAIQIQLDRTTPLFPNSA